MMALSLQLIVFLPLIAALIAGLGGRVIGKTAAKVLTTGSLMVGAVAVLFLFVVMMLDIDFARLRSGFTRNLPFGLLIALVLLAEIVIAANARSAGPLIADRPPETVQPNIVALGEALYSRFLLPFELAGLILLVAMVGAIVLTHRRRGDARGQNASRQIGRRPEDAVKLEKPLSGEGVKL